MLKRRAYTLAELAATFAVLGLLVVLFAVATGGSERAGRDAQARIALDGLIGAQHLRHDTFGSFTASQSTLEGMLAQYTFTSALDPSTGGTVLSVSVGDDATGEFFAAAAIGGSGACYTVRSYESSSTVDDTRRMFTDLDPTSCNAAYAVSARGGEAW